MNSMSAKWIPKRLIDISLINIASQARDGQLLVDTCEEEYRQRISMAVDALQKTGRRLVMLTGPSSSGKTTTTHKLAEELRRRGTVAKVISLDDFYRDPENYPRLPDGSKDYENVTALDIPLINACLSEVVNTGKTMLPRFDFLTERRAPEKEPLDIGDGVLLVEGIHAHNPCLVEQLPKDKVYKVYAGMREEYSLWGQRILPTRDVRLVRRMVRDHKFRGHSPVKTLSMWAGVCEGEDKYIKVFKPSTDWILDTSFTYEIECLAPHVAQLAKEFCDGTPATEKLASLAKAFALCTVPLGELVPKDSMLREFLG